MSVDMQDFYDDEIVSACCGAGIDTDIPICQQCGEWSEPINLSEDE